MINDKSKLAANELLKEASPTLAGSIATTLQDPSVDRFSDDDIQFLKFHGIYQQDDRDLRKTGKKYLFMIRGRIPGGILSPEQYRVYDDLATRYANNTLRITTRQSFQFHGVVKAGLGPLMKAINRALMTTLAACGDVARNVMAPPTPVRNGLGARVQADARLVSDALLPVTPAYHAIWVEGVQLDLGEAGTETFNDPLYGRTYLPRKFKVGFAVPPLNDVDLLTQCLGFIAIADEQGQLAGYNLTAGGGMGRSHGNQETYPRVADVVGFVPPDKVVEASKAVLGIHRDFGDRTDRKHARLKYVLEERGVDWFRRELERRLGFALAPARPFTFTHQHDLYGWHTQHDGRWFLGLFVENGRVKDADGRRLKTALREVADRFHVEFRLTPSQNLLIANVTAADKAAIDALLAGHGIEAEAQFSAVRRASMACPALPTCGLALAESERYLPELMTRIEGLLAELGLGEEEIIIRMTGCPNGCARPYMSEIGFVGKGPGRYQLWLGGNEGGTRLNRVYKEMVKDPEIIGELSSLLQRFVGERQNGERFGDWVARVLWPEAAVN
ncbi:MAG: NADPH-dependent assimilatory sulfite reductase hemoprotein subunit [Verrucomicrobiales bacterium]|nr:NADPH-dependent assimilatory sulfite reductase hemoprotein subunit [Verrucomicrobiales bacterium]